MIILSKQSSIVIRLFDEGYRVTEDGCAVLPSGDKVNVYPKHGGYLNFKRYHTDVQVHRLAAYQKFGDKLFCEGIEVRHLDGDCQNNMLDNIAIGTHSQNEMDKPIEVRRRQAFLASSRVRRLTIEGANYLREVRENGMAYSGLIKLFGVSKSTVSYIVNGKIYSIAE